MRIILMGLALLTLNSCGMAVRGEMGKACMASGRSAANSALCNCVQTAANGTLDSRDQRLASRFFEDPQRAQDVRQSDSPGDEAFWSRYRQFTAQAERVCR
ncbi:hypothetical protein SAMN04488003_111110 [Loktanella fryxellensis]|uniref:Arginine transporter n=1 Tax=Loktanella fryxellensis TaxID=245187 RepID=A0A1H8EVK9_9RHOB|nr:arginine transporter [Loktanella fryxellensis]SEN23174.1 hypothetical protein SAMN04488003_111110 [Loktanella fryxellensis]